MIPLLVLAAALAAAPAPRPAHAAPATPEALLEKAQAKMKSLDFDVAQTILTELLARPGLAAPLKANALVSLGITRFNLGQSAEARAAFDQALAADPTVALPKRVAPKIAEVFADAQKARATAVVPPPQPPPPVEVKPQPPVAVDPKIVVARPEQTPPPPSTVEGKALPTAGAEPAVEVKQSAGHSFTWPVVVAVVAVAGVGVGLGTGVGSAQAGRDLRTGLHSAADADALLSKQKTLSAASIAGYVAGGVAGALAITLLSGEIAGHWFSGTAAVTPSGASVALSTSF